jgi:hypothetical protein
MLYIYSENITSRLEYVCKVLFKNVLQIEYSFASEIDFEETNGVLKLNYSQRDFEATLTIRPYNLLWESHIASQEIVVTHLDGVPYFFKTDAKNELPYDILSMSFYVLSRYEEYLPFTPDAHGRFSAKESLAYKANFLHLPVVQLWVEVLKKEFLKQIPDYNFPTLQFSQINTLDIDVAYAVKGKPIVRQVGGLIKSLVKGNFNDIKNRLNYYFSGKDAYDTYNYIFECVENQPIETIFFLEIGHHNKYDRNLPLNRVYVDLIKKLAGKYTVGIHPSYFSNTDKNELSKLIKKLQKIVERPITHSRQHFLKLQFPQTYERLIENGITSDYTMGFSDQIGYRAGIAIPFPFFNLHTNMERPLQIVPFQIMEGTMKDYLKIAPQDAISEIKKYKKQLQDTGGTFVSIFHNSSLTDSGEWKGWRQVYQSLFD